MQKRALFIEFGRLGWISHFQVYFICTTICFSSPKAINLLSLLPVVQVIAGGNFIHQIPDPYIIRITILLALHNSFHATHYLMLKTGLQSSTLHLGSVPVLVNSAIIRKYYRLITPKLSLLIYGACSPWPALALFKLSSHSGTQIKGEVPIWDIPILMEEGKIKNPESSS